MLLVATLYIGGSRENQATTYLSVIIAFHRILQYHQLRDTIEILGLFFHLDKGKAESSAQFCGVKMSRTVRQSTNTQDYIEYWSFMHIQVIK